MKKILRIGISSCLLGNLVRWNGEDAGDRRLIETLGLHADWVPVCPEVESGFGVPRESMQLAGATEAPRLVTTRTGKDHTDRMLNWARGRVRDLEKEDLSGFIFKESSPSCGLTGVKVFDEKGRFIRNGVGLFARVFMDHFPMLPVEEDGRLHDLVILKRFMDRISP